ncbi:MAG TPA: prephenate dehydratase domain-containing protein [Terriglobales bacterium]|nr:prephenate dehydratase domain-containing protein [Terriglobales bacterium]
MRIAIQGIAGCFSEEAARTLHPRARMVACPDFAGIFAALEQGRAERGLLPVENSIAGPILESQALLAQHRVRVVADLRHRIELCLLLLPGAHRAGVRRVLSHPVALRQCGRFLEPTGWQIEAFFDTAASAREILRRGQADLAAIAGARAAAVYGAQVAKRAIADRRQNLTRFLLIAPRPRSVLNDRARR